MTLAQVILTHIALISYIEALKNMNHTREVGQGGLIVGLNIDEQELHISASRTEDYATAYCSDTTWITKFDKLVKKSPDLFRVVAETDYGKTYQFPKRLISIRSNFVTRDMTDEQKALAAERLKNARAKNNS